MSDQDFFFEDEETESAEKPAAKKPAAKSGAPKPAAKPAGKPAAAKAASAPSGSFFDQPVSMAVASLIAVIALLVGVIGGYAIGGANSAQVPASTTVTPGTGTPGQLTPEQLNSGQLPPGHPSIGATGTAPGSKAATPTGK